MLIQKEPAFRSSYLFDLLAQLPTGMFASVDIYIDPSGTHRPHYFVPFPAAMPWAATEVMSAGRIVPMNFRNPAYTDGVVAPPQKKATTPTFAPAWPMECVANGKAA